MDEEGEEDGSHELESMAGLEQLLNNP